MKKKVDLILIWCCWTSELKRSCCNNNNNHLWKPNRCGEAERNPSIISSELNPFNNFDFLYAERVSQSQSILQSCVSVNKLSKVRQLSVCVCVCAYMYMVILLHRCVYVCMWTNQRLYKYRSFGSLNPVYRPLEDSLFFNVITSYSLAA